MPSDSDECLVLAGIKRLTSINNITESEIMKMEIFTLIGPKTLLYIK